VFGADHESDAVLETKPELFAVFKKIRKWNSISYQDFFFS